MSNPFDDPPPTRRQAMPMPLPHAHQHPSSRNKPKREEPIWEARHIEWPLPSTLPSFQDPTSNLLSSATSSTAVGSNNPISADIANKSTAAATSGSNPGYLGGLVGKFIGQTPGGISGTEKETIDSSQLHGKARALKAPRPRCTASANGWVVSVVESGSVSSASHARLLSRWNVRRNTHQCLLVPNTVQGPSGGAGSSSASAGSSLSKKGRIMHVFVDPTGCHSLISGNNGDLFYSHTSSQTVRKLPGFGLNADGSGNFIPGKPWREVSSSSIASTTTSAFGVGAMAQRDSSGVQLGLTPGCYVTAVGWNKMGTERSTNKILLGSSFGEIYEYEVEADMMDEAKDVYTSYGGSGGGGSDEDRLPSLMVRLNESESGTGTGTSSGVVSGLYFCMDTEGGNESNSGVAVLAATSGVNKQTRLHSYLSVGVDKEQTSSTNPVQQKMRSAFSLDENLSRKSFMELPGSINFADLKVCNSSFAMRTETGIYYGIIDNSNTRNVPWNKRGNGIIDAGMFSYETSSIPIAIAITPHHFITLSETNEVRFINRVAKKTVQKDRVDWVSMAHSSGSTRGGMDDGLFTGTGLSELLMDVRRPDQVWLRKSRSLVHISSTREDRDVWKFSLEACLKGKSHGSFATSHASMRRLNDDKYMDVEFEHTKSLCTNNAQKAVVTAARAEFHLSHGRIELAAKYMAQCPPSLVPFAETAIRLALPSLGIKDTRPKGESTVAKEVLQAGNAGLISYLTDKLRSAKSRNDGVACTMIGAWLVELYLHEREHNSGGTNIQLDGGGETQGRNVNASHAMMQKFLSNNTYNMDAKTILSILCSHDVAASECAAYAASSGDIGTAINAALCNVDYMVS